MRIPFLTRETPEEKRARIFLAMERKRIRKEAKSKAWRTFLFNTKLAIGGVATLVILFVVKVATTPRDELKFTQTPAKPQRLVVAEEKPPAPVAAPEPDKTIHVKGYYRKNGTYVEPYDKSAPKKGVK